MTVVLRRVRNCLCIIIIIITYPVICHFLNKLGNLVSLDPVNTLGKLDTLTLPSFSENLVDSHC